MMHLSLKTRALYRTDSDYFAVKVHVDADVAAKYNHQLAVCHFDNSTLLYGYTVRFKDCSTERRKFNRCLVCALVINYVDGQ